MFPNQDHGHLSVLEDGTLLITSVLAEDSGEYLCKGLSIAGTAVAKVRLDVIGKPLSRRRDRTELIRNVNKNSSGDEIANVNFYAVRPEGTRIR